MMKGVIKVLTAKLGPDRTVEIAAAKMRTTTNANASQRTKDLLGDGHMPASSLAMLKRMRGLSHGRAIFGREPNATRASPSRPYFPS
jgi:hypothetical protein